MGAKTNAAVGKRQSVAEKAREARIKLYRDRDARDARVESAAAEVFTAQDELASAGQALESVKAAAAASIEAAEVTHRAAVESGEVAMSSALRKLTAEKLTAAEIAELTSLTAADVRRLTRPAASSSPRSASADGADPLAVAV